MLDLLLTGIRPEDACKVGEAKLAFAGTAVGVLGLTTREPGR